MSTSQALAQIQWENPAEKLDRHDELITVLKQIARALEALKPANRSLAAGLSS